jgi:hypothetical protein
MTGAWDLTIFLSGPKVDDGLTEIDLGKVVARVGNLGVRRVFKWYVYSNVCFAAELGSGSWDPGHSRIGRGDGPSGARIRSPSVAVSQFEFVASPSRIPPGCQHFARLLGRRDFTLR